jgi:hypothetical protein
MSRHSSKCAKPRSIRRVAPRSSHTVMRESVERKRRSWLMITSAVRRDSRSFSSHSMVVRSR